MSKTFPTNKSLFHHCTRTSSSWMTKKKSHGRCANHSHIMLLPVTGLQQPDALENPDYFPPFESVGYTQWRRRAHPPYCVAQGRWPAKRWLVVVAYGPNKNQTCIRLRFCIPMNLKPLIKTGSTKPCITSLSLYTCVYGYVCVMSTRRVLGRVLQQGGVDWWGGGSQSFPIWSCPVCYKTHLFPSTSSTQNGEGWGVRRW